jgi:biopolymer transport protein ExbD
MSKVSLRFVRKKVSGGGRRSMEQSLNLTSMIDFLMVVVIFLLSTFSAASEATVPREVKLPNATNVLETLTAPTIAVAGNDVYCENKAAGNVQEALEKMSSGNTVVPTKFEELYARLTLIRDTWKSVHPDTPDDFPGMVVMELDQDLKAYVVKSLFYTAAQAGYTNVNFLVNRSKKGGGGSGGESGSAP